MGVQSRNNIKIVRQKLGMISSTAVPEEKARTTAPKSSPSPASQCKRNEVILGTLGGYSRLSTVGKRIIKDTQTFGLSIYFSSQYGYDTAKRQKLHRFFESLLYGHEPGIGGTRLKRILIGLNGNSRWELQVMTKDVTPDIDVRFIRQINGGQRSYQGHFDISSTGTIRFDAYGSSTGQALLVGLLEELGGKI